MNSSYTFSGRFYDRDLEAQFIDKAIPEKSRRIFIVSLLTGAAYLTGLFSDLFRFAGTPALNYMVAARLATFSTALLCAFVSRGGGRRSSPRFLLLYYIAITLSECLELLLDGSLGEQGLPVLLLIVLFYYLVFPVPLIHALAGSSAAGFLYCGILLKIHHYPIAGISPTVTAFLLVSAISSFFSIYINRTSRADFMGTIQLRETNENLQKEIDRRKNIQTKLETIATRDELTSVYNRRHFMELAQRELKRAERIGCDVGLLFMDIDHFKKINDTYGHDSGDLVLKELASLCQSSVRIPDIFCRYGGEEFIVLLPGDDREQTCIAAERLRKAVADRQFSLQGRDKVSVTISLGAALSKKGTVPLDELIKRADQALYRAKKGGRNRVETYFVPSSAL